MLVSALVEVGRLGVLPSMLASPAVLVMIYAVLSQQNVSRELLTVRNPYGVAAPTCESRFKAPLHTAQAGLAIILRPGQHRFPVWGIE